MIRPICDCCGKVADDYWHMSYTGNNEVVDLCEECFQEFLNWRKNKSENKGNAEDYEKAARDCQQQIINLEEIPDKIRGSRDQFMTSYLSWQQR